MKEILDSKTVSTLVPKIYEDAVQPAVKELSKGLLVTAKAINLALEPVNGVVWGYETIKKHIIDALSKRLEHLPQEQLVPPPLNVAGPLVESMKYSAYDENLRELYTNLLCTSMVSERAHKAHPSFVEVIKQISPDEAKILKHIFTSCPIPEVHHAVINVGRNDYVFEELKERFFEICGEVDLDRKDLVPSYLDNLKRLQIVEFDHKIENDVLTKEDYIYDPEYEDLNKHINIGDIETRRFEFLKISDYGMQFFYACIET